MMFKDFEKHLGLKVKVLNEYEDKNDEGLNDPLLDLDIYEKVMKNTLTSI